jgi:ubiquinone/menaquinone biosynthesis C-methylase UbiE
MNNNVSKEYYNSQKNDAGTSYGVWHDQMINAFTEFVIDKPKDSRIVDIGCYRGHGLLHLKNLGYSNLFGIDLIKENVEYFMSRGIGGYELDMHDMSIIPDKFFDLCFMSHSIEHSIDPVKVLKEVIRISKKGLIIFPLEPNSVSIVNPPHYYTFNNKQSVVDVVSKCFSSYKLEEKQREGLEIWCLFE